jgi:hypothetical protein
VYTGLGIAPAVVGAIVALGTKLVGFLFGPSEYDILKQEARNGNVVAWWRMKAQAGPDLPAKGTFNGKPFDAKALITEEREALKAALGPNADQGICRTAGDSNFVCQIYRNPVYEFYADGLGDALDKKAAETLHPPLSAGFGNLPGWALAGAMGIILISLFRR